MPTLRKDCTFQCGYGKFVEYRGRGGPCDLKQKIGRVGDVYLDLTGFKVWYFTDKWISWDRISRSHVHPNHCNRFLAPEKECFTWANFGLYADVKMQAKEMFGQEYSPKDIISKYYPSEYQEKQEIPQEIPVLPVDSQKAGPSNKRWNAFDEAPLDTLLDTTSASASSQEEITVLPVDSPNAAPANKKRKLLHSLMAGTLDRRFVSDNTSTQFPANCHTVEWPSLGLETYGPFTESEQGDHDRAIVKFLAACPEASNASGGPSVVYLQLPSSFTRSTGEGSNEEDFAAEKEFLLKVRTNLANNVAVIVKGFKSQYNMDFDIRDFERMGRQLDRPVQAQDARTRPEKMYTESPLENFIRAAEDPTTCCNVLDYCTLVGESPVWLQHFRDNICAMEMTWRGAYRNSNQSVGPSNAQFDMWRQQAWELHTHGGFLTYPHHDASGLCTYVFARSGAKIWSFIRPDIGKYEKRDGLFKALDGFGYPDGYNSIEEVGTILLEPGSLLIQPPGLYHMVYTPVKGTTAGGHFYMYETMHLTELTWSYDSTRNEDGTRRSEFATNEDHPAMSRFLARMVLALPYISKRRDFKKRPLYAMIYMVHKMFLKKPSKNLDVVQREISQELRAAHEIVDRMRAEWGMTWKDLEKYTVELPKSWDDVGPIIDLNFLETFCNIR